MPQPRRRRGFLDVSSVSTAIVASLVRRDRCSLVSRSFTPNACSTSAFTRNVPTPPRTRLERRHVLAEEPELHAVPVHERDVALHLPDAAEVLDLVDHDDDAIACDG
jgi:hypothetical protein